MFIAIIENTKIADFRVYKPHGISFSPNESTMLFHIEHSGICNVPARHHVEIYTATFFRLGNPSVPPSQNPK